MERLACYDQIAESLVGEENKITVKPDQDTPIVAKEIKAKDQNVAIIEEDEQSMCSEIELEIEASFSRAQSAPYPDPLTASCKVYA